MNLDNNGKEKSLMLVYQLEQPIPITAIHIEALSESKILVLFATGSPTRLYHGVSSTIQQLFQSRGEEALSFVELPGSIDRTDLVFYSRAYNTRAKYFALRTEVGLYTGPMHMADNSSSSDYIQTESQLLHFHNSVESVPSISMIPFSIAVTEYHFLLLNEKSLQVMSRLSGDIVQHESIINYFNYGKPIGLLKDAMKGSLLLYSSLGSIYQVLVADEGYNDRRP